MSAEMTDSEFGNYKQWETQFDVALKQPGPLQAWRKLRGKGCDAQCLKGALFHAEESLKRALTHDKVAEFSEARDTALSRLSDFQKTLAWLVSINAQGRPVSDQLLSFWGFSEESIRNFGEFPKHLQEFGGVLKFLTVPEGKKRNLDKDAEIAAGEALLHFYVEEITASPLYDQTAVLLEAATECCQALGGLPEYSSGAVRRRHRRRFPPKSPAYEEMKALVKHLRTDGGKFLKKLLKAMVVESAFESAFRSGLCKSFSDGAEVKLSVSGPMRSLRGCPDKWLALSRIAQKDKVNLELV